MELSMREMEITIGELQSVVKWLQGKLEQAKARATALQAVVDNLCEQQDRQIDMEACGYRQSYSSKFPEWEQAWEAARAVRWGVE